LLVGLLATNLMIQRKVRQAREQFGDASAAKVEAALKEEAASNPVLRGLWGSFGAGNADMGRVSQLASFKEKTPVESGVVAGALPFLPYGGSPAGQGIFGGYSTYRAREALSGQKGK